MDLYAVYATSDPVIVALVRRGLIQTKDIEAGSLPIEAKPVPSLFGAPTPLMKLTATGSSPAAATRLTVGATDAFIAYLKSRQDAARIPEKQRVQARILERYGAPLLAKPRSKTGLIAILLAGLTATVAAAFIRDNLQRTRQSATGDPEPASLPGAVPLAAVNEGSQSVSPLAHAAASTEREPSGSDGEPALRESAASRWAPRSSR